MFLPHKRRRVAGIQPNAGQSGRKRAPIMESASKALDVTIPARIDQACAKENSRYAISGANIRFSPDAEPIAEATDGHMLAVVQCEGDKGEVSAIVPSASLKKRVKGRINLEVNGDARNKDIGASFDLVNGSFPPCRDVVPRSLAGEVGNIRTVALNAKLLSRLADAIGSGTGGVVLSFDTAKPAGPIRVMPADPDAPLSLGVLMPIKYPGKPRDDWARRIDAFYPSKRG